MAQTKITNELLKQAIADAEAVRETAVANAKLVLEEAITPQIRDMIARRLRVEAESAETEVTDLQEETAVVKPHEEGEAEGNKEFPADSSDVGQDDNKEPSDDSFDTSEIGDGPENAGDSEDDWYEDWSESDFDLNEVIAELEADIAALTDDPQEEEGEEEVGTDSQKHPHAFGTPELKRDGVDADAEEELDDDEELDLEEILAELEADEEEEAEEEIPEAPVADAPVAPEAPAVDPDKERMAAEIADLKAEMAQYREVVHTLRGKLNEVNLLNAKLLFTNKMFRKEGLSNEQKVRIVESFDRATTVREVKLVYTALMENISTNRGGAPGASRRKVVAEGIASKATPSTAPKREAIVENATAKRLQELAGLI